MTSFKFPLRIVFISGMPMAGVIIFVSL